MSVCLRGLVSPLPGMLGRMAGAARAAGTRAMSSFSASERKAVSGLTGRVCAVLGSQWGDEGKGKLVCAQCQWSEQPLVFALPPTLRLPGDGACCVTLGCRMCVCLCLC